MNEECGCCEGTEVLTPTPIANRPGLPALAYRAGTHAGFLESMLARLASSAYPALRRLTSRDGADPAVAFLDAWATVADVLTFYQERIANEGYLRTAVERRSILELARLVGYRLRPGVAASVYLAYTLDPDRDVVIPVGSRAQSVPGPGEQMQSFETAEPLAARAAWNTLGPRLTRPQAINRGTMQLYFQGTATNLKPNDRLLLVFDQGTDDPVIEARIVTTVKLDVIADRTYVTLRLHEPGDTSPPAGPPIAGDTVAGFRAVAQFYRQLAEFDLSPRSTTVRAVLAQLDNLAAVPSAATRSAVLGDIRQRYRLAQDRGHNRVARWLASLITALEDEGKGLALSTLIAAAGEPAAGRSQSRRNLADLLPALREPPSLPPASSARLARTVAGTFGTPAEGGRTDIAPQLLVAMQPELKSTFYRAWANAERTPATPTAINPTLDSVQALRVRAAPFGSNAPLRPVLDERGIAIGYEEWPLAGTVMVGVSVDSDLFHNDEPPTALRPVVMVTRDLKLQRTAVPLDNIFQTGLNEVITVTEPVRDEEGLVTLECRFTSSDFPESPGPFSIKFIREGEEIFMMITHDTEVRRRLFAGQSLRYDITVFDDNYGVNVVRRVTVTVTPPLTSTRTTPIVTLAEEPWSEFGSPPEEVPIPPPAEGTIVVTAELALPVTQTRGESWNVVTLDAQYDHITPGSWVLIERPDPAEPTRQKLLKTKVADVQTVAKAQYGIAAGKLTQLSLVTPWLDARDRWLTVLRGTNVYALSETLADADDGTATQPLAEEPIETPLCGATVELDGLYGGLQSGRWLIIAGERVDENLPPGVPGVELVMLAGVSHGRSERLPGDPIHTTIQLAAPLAYCYKRATATIYGNVVRATHGETRSEVLGSGDAGRPFQAFALQQKPLTYVSAPTPAGVESTLVVRVNDLRWDEVDSLANLPPTARRYVTQAADDDQISVIFGDGENGVRPSTGVENIQATYRTGIGKPGNVRAGQINVLATRPLGVREVINPLPATGGADREDRDQARRNVPIAALAVDRLLAVQDYADFARTFAGIGKASAVRLSNGRRQVVHLTVAGTDDIPIALTSDLYRNLYQALLDYGDPHQAVVLATRELLALVISAKVRILPAYRWESVVDKIRAALFDRFSFARRDLGQDVTAGEVIGAIQAVEGVAYVDLEILDTVDEQQAILGWTGRRSLASDLRLHSRIRIALARRAPDPPGGIYPAQLAFLRPEVPDTVILTELPA